MKIGERDKKNGVKSFMDNIIMIILKCFPISFFISDYLEYRNRFLMPLSDETRKSGELHYSFDLGPVHFISLNVEVNFTYIPKYRLN